MGIKEFGRELTDKVKGELRDYFKERDYMVIAVPEKEPIRVYTLKATNTVKEAQLIHGFPHIVAVAVGRAICGALLLTSLIKHASNQKILLKITGTGAIREIFVEADGHGRVRCFANYEEPEIAFKEANGVKKLDISKVIGAGTLSVTKDLGLGEPYTGIVPLISGEIAQDLAYYLLKSEQIPSAVATGVLIDEKGVVKQAGGFLIQPLGGASPKVIEEIEKRAREFPSVSKLLEEGKRPEDMAIMLLEGMAPHLIGLKEIRYYCPCSQEVVEKLIKNMPEETINKHFRENEVLEITCNFCKSVYRFTREEVERIRAP